MKTAIESSASARLSLPGFGSTLAILIKIGRLHIVAIAAMAVFTFGWLFTGRYPWLLTFVCALDWYIVNLINRIADLPEDKVNAIDGTQFVLKNRLRIEIATYTLLLMSLIVVHLYLPAITGLRLAGHVLGLCYNWPLLPGKRRLKQLFFWKNTASGIGFLITAFGYPLAAMMADHSVHFPNDINWLTVLFSAVFFYAFIQSYEILYDLRDIRGDRLVGVKSYPIVYGQKNAVLLIDGLVLFAMTVLIAGYLFSTVPWRIFIMIGAPVLQLLVYKRALLKHKKILKRDCIQITWLGVVLFIVYHLWVVAGLPGSEI